MLKNILNLEGAKTINRKDQKAIQGGFGNYYPRTEEECLQCGGEWGAFAFGPGGLCALSRNSPCA
ncbi:hypothetical protein [Aquimarina sp. 2304DJ70-9]|uniref:hypothetical protein n=1 Tax=Aquimarina penaris TaxID=3231044 RepID=UPI003461F0D6